MILVAGFLEVVHLVQSVRRQCKVAELSRRASDITWYKVRDNEVQRPRP